MKVLTRPTTPVHFTDAGLDVREERRLRRQVRRLRFDPLVEARFRRDYEDASGPDRLALVVVAALSVVLTPFYDMVWLHPPDAFITPARWLQFGVQLPAMVLVMVFALEPLRRWQPMVLMLATLLVAGGLMGQRIVGARHGFEVPLQFPTLTVAGVYAMGRLRFQVFAPWAALILTLAGAAEIYTFGSGSRAAYDCIALAIGWSVISVGGYVLERAAREAWIRRQQLTFLALHDPLTGLPNRRFFDRVLERALAEATVTRGAVALMLLDVDHFKSFNDRYGHPAGDACLQKIGGWLQAQALAPGSGCFCARLGGEEFAALWTGPAAPGAKAWAERLRQGIGALNIPHAQERDPSAVVTASGGFTRLMPAAGAGVGASMPAPSLDPSPGSGPGLGPGVDPQKPPGLATRLVARADALLYEAKRAGRNQLMAA